MSAAGGGELEEVLAGNITVAAGQSQPVTMSTTEPGRTTLTFNKINGGTWSIVPGTILTIGPDTANEETVVVTSVTTPANPPQYSFTATRSHNAGERIISRSNPGPWPRYDPRNEPRVVSYFSVID